MIRRKRIELHQLNELESKMKTLNFAGRAVLGVTKNVGKKEMRASEITTSECHENKYRALTILRDMGFIELVGVYEEKRVIDDDYSDYDISFKDVLSGEVYNDPNDLYANRKYETISGAKRTVKGEYKVYRILYNSIEEYKEELIEKIQNILYTLKG